MKRMQTELAAPNTHRGLTRILLASIQRLADHDHDRVQDLGHAHDYGPSSEAPRLALTTLISRTYIPPHYRQGWIRTRKPEHCPFEGAAVAPLPSRFTFAEEPSESVSVRRVDRVDWLT